MAPNIPSDVLAPCVGTEDHDERGTEGDNLQGWQDVNQHRLHVRGEDEGASIMMGLPRRERQVLETLCSCSSGTVSDVRKALDDPPSYSTVRTVLARLEKKGFVQRQCQSESRAHLYLALLAPVAAQETALRRLVSDVFEGSAIQAAAILLTLTDDVEDEELETLQLMIDEAKARRGL